MKARRRIVILAVVSAGGVYWLNDTRLAIALVASSVVFSLGILEAYATDITRKIDDIRQRQP